MTRLRQLALLGLFVTPTLGFTNCEYFDTVTVQASDSTVPIAGTRFWEGSRERITTYPVHLDTHDISTERYLFPYGLDSNGLRELKVGHHVDVRCTDNTGVHFHLRELSATQAGGVGSSVSNGQWLSTTFTPEDFDSCGASSVDAIIYEWVIVATDFHGNSTTIGPNSLTYTP